jgi:signal transduction histidine kinase
MQARVAQAAVQVHRSLPSDLPLVLSNEKQLEIVFINLIKNALDAMEGVRRDRHSLSLIGSTQNGSVSIRVRDTGMGIPAKDVSHIFEPYYSTKGRKGTGMGLYLTQQIVKAHGGSIEVRSEEGEGSEFVLTLPKFGDKASGVQAA